MPRRIPQPSLQLVTSAVSICLFATSRCAFALPDVGSRPVDVFAPPRAHNAHHMHSSLASQDVYANALQTRYASSAYPTVRVCEPTGECVDATQAWAWTSLANESWTTTRGLAYELSSVGQYALYTWSVGCYGTQGGYIAEKLSALGRDQDIVVLRGHLLQLPINNDGKVWEAGNVEWHVGNQGSWEAPAEAIIMARHYLAHTGDTAIFRTAPERLACVCTSPDTCTSVGVPHPQLPPDFCSMKPSDLLAGWANVLFVDGPSPPFNQSAYADGLNVTNSGRVVLGTYVMPTAFTSVAVPLVQRYNNHVLWACTLSLVDVRSGLTVASTPVTSLQQMNTWVSITAPSGTVPAGTYTVVLAAQDTTPGALARSGFYLAPAWLSDAYPAVSGGADQASYGNATLWLRRSSADDALSSERHTNIEDALQWHRDVMSRRLERRGAVAVGLGRSLGDILLDATAFQLTLMTQLGNASLSPSGVDLYLIPDVRFRGSTESNVNSACSYYDLLRIGGASSYINLRVLEALEAMQDMQSAGVVSAGPLASPLCGASHTCAALPPVSIAVAALRAAIAARMFDTDSMTWADWVGCNSSCRSDDTEPMSACGYQQVFNGSVPAKFQPCLQSVSSHFVPTASLAAKLAVPASSFGVSATQQVFEQLRDSARVSPGWWRVNNVGLETVTPRTTISSRAWKLTDAAGYAIEVADNTGDWHMFEPPSTDGYGAWQRQAENGGRFHTTTAMIFEAQSTPYAAAYSDWKRMVTALTDAGLQLAAANATEPLLAADRGYLATPVNNTIVHGLCDKARAGFTNNSDLWGHYMCAFYQDAAFGLPENGVAIYSFVKGILGFNAFVNGSYTLLSQPGPACGSSTAPASVCLCNVTSVDVLGLRVWNSTLSFNCAFTTASSPIPQCPVGCSSSAVCSAQCS